MSGMERPSKDTDVLDVDGLTPAAVLVPVLQDERPRRLLFTRRAPDLDAHPGQMSFPGGRAEPTDQNLTDTALRETTEEIGINSDAVEIVGQLSPITTVTGFYVEPLIGRIPDGPFHPQDDEVAEIITLPMQSFLAEDIYEQERREHPDGGEVTVHYFHVEDQTVWGATASILVQYLEQERGWEPPR